MPSDPAAPQPPHPVPRLTTSELNAYRRDLERAIKGTSPEAPAVADLRRRLAEVLAEQDDRARM
jgi:hypothetical protein